MLVMNSLLEKEGLAGKVQMIYLDPLCGPPHNGSSVAQSVMWRPARFLGDHGIVTVLRSEPSCSASKRSTAGQ